MNKIKELYNKSKKWVLEHKKIVIGSICGVAAVGLGAALVNKNKDNNNNEDYIEDTTDYGRDCIMKFVVNDDSQEVLGEVPCTELYAREELDTYNSYKDND